LKKCSTVKRYRASREWPQYVHNPIGEFNEAFVQANRERPGSKYSTNCACSARVRSPRSRARRQRLGEGRLESEGERPTIGSKRTRVVDSWIHLQDIRDALLQPRTITGPAKRSS